LTAGVLAPTLPPLPPPTLASPGVPPLKLVPRALHLGADRPGLQLPPSPEKKRSTKGRHDRQRRTHPGAV
ncbi:MAG TPA: hypothetical protein VF945_12280, partial [Polyangia bacterium]